jgi:uncharacterized protein with HEPN domain
MDNMKTDSYYIQKITTDLAFLVAHTDGLSQEQLEEQEILLDSVMFRLIQVSENSDKLSENFKLQHSEIPWRAMKGLRNRIVHEYGAVDITVVYDTVRKDIPELLHTLESL